ncbi:MAG TPA: pyridoxal-phosphate dependent enzyme, partial [Gaiellaceae bacterium]|nr:pyridoxal-phosphate dependent enzyme [Gaiellaceae bacterium]
MLAGTAVRTPLVRLNAPEAEAEIYLKLENIQPIGSFKLRGAYNAARRADPAEVARGLSTASAGNMGQGVAWAARELGVPCSVIVPDYAPQTKVAAMERLGAKVLKVPFDDWWTAMENSQIEGVDGLFLHPVENEQVMAGNGTIGL